MPPMKPKTAVTNPPPPPVEAVPREMEYPEVEAQVFRGADALTVDQAKHLLGWEEEPEGAKWDDWFLVDENGKKVRLTHNAHNRHFRPALCELYIQEILQRRWRLNGETIIIGQYAETVDGQHRLIALVLAEQRRLNDRETNGHWTENWPESVTIDCIVVTGIEETDEVVNSINTGAGRSMADVLYRSEYFQAYPPSKRKQMARACDYAIRFLWHRTGAGMDAFAPRRTHSEAIDFLGRHPRLIKCLEHVVNENGDAENRIGKHLSLGYSAALMYMMGCGSSDYDAYKLSDPPTERKLDWSGYKRAETFWALLAGSPDFQEVRYAIGMLTDLTIGKRASVAEVVSVVVKAWRVFAEPGFKAFREGDPRINLGADSYQLKDDVRILTDNPTCGGIDLGEPKDEIPIRKPAEEPPEAEPTPEEEAEVEAEKEAVRDENVDSGDSGKGVNDLVSAARREWPGRLIAWRHKDHYRVWGKDADACVKVVGMKRDPKLKVDGLQYLRFDEAYFPEVAKQMIKSKMSGYTHVVVVKAGPKGPELLDADYDPDAKAAAKPKRVAKKGGA